MLLEKPELCRRLLGRARIGLLGHAALLQDPPDRREVLADRVDRVQPAEAPAPESGRGLERWEDGRVAEPVTTSAGPSDPDGLIEDEAGGEVSERDDDLGSHVIELRLEIGPARLDLVGQGIAVPGWAALDHIDDRSRGSIQPDLRQEPVEKLARGPDEGKTLPVLVETGGLTDEQEVGVEVPIRPHDLGASLGKPATRASEGPGTNLVDRKPDRRGHGPEDTRATIAVGAFGRETFRVQGGSPADFARLDTDPVAGRDEKVPLATLRDWIRIP